MIKFKHPNFVQWYAWYNMSYSLNSEGILMELADGDTRSLIEKCLDRVGRAPLSPGRPPQPPASGQRWQTLAGGGEPGLRGGRPEEYAEKGA